MLYITSLFCGGPFLKFFGVPVGSVLLIEECMQQRSGTSGINTQIGVGTIQEPLHLGWLIFNTNGC